MSFSESKQHQFTHMSRGTHPAYQDSSALWDAHNIRLTSREGETKFAIVNEKSTREVYDLTEIFASEGPVYLIGQAVVGDYLAVFLHKDDYQIDGTDYPDCILRFDMTTYDADAQTIDDPVILYRGDLGFNPAYPLQCVIDKESEKIEKIYWTDGINKPRMINICKPELADAEYSSAGDDEQDIANTLGYTAFYPDAPFDFVQTMTLDEECSVERLTSGSGGVFPAGTIQYALTYYFKYGQETNIFYTSEILYMSYADRGAAADNESLNCAFRITVKNPESEKFDYLRIYSIQRTSLDDTPTVQQVADINLHDEKSLLTDTDDEGNEYSYVQFVDTNTTGADVDSDKLLLLGSKDITCGCMFAKDNTLFMGDITYIRKDIDEIDFSNNDTGTSSIDYLKNQITPQEYTRRIQISADESDEKTTNEDSFYHWKNQLRVNTSTFKRGEEYRLGIQFQYKTGEWSEPVWVGDCKMPYDKVPYAYVNNNVWKMVLPEFKGTVSEDDAADLLAAGYLKVRPLIVLPDAWERNILAQGVVCPTVFQSQARRDNAPFSFSSWLFRFMGSDPTGDQINMGLKGSVAQWRHFNSLTSGRSSGAEIQNMAIAEDYATGLDDDNKYRVLGDYDAWCAVTGKSTLLFGTDLCVNYFGLKYISKMLEGDDSLDDVTGDYASAYGIWYVDWSTCTLHSPDIEFLPSVQTALDHNDNIGIRIVGAVPFMQSYGDIDIDLKSVQVDPEAHGFTHAITHNATNGGAELISGLFFHDAILDDKSNGEEIAIINETSDEGKKHYRRMWMTHLWHRAGSLNNDMTRGDEQGTRSAELNTKVIANIHYSEDNIWFKDELINDSSELLELDVDDHECFNQEDVQLTKLHDIYNVNGNINYYGNVDFMNASYTAFKLVTSESNRATTIDYDDDGNEVTTSSTVNLQTSISYTASLRYQKFEKYESTENKPIGDSWTCIVTPTEGVRMKYLSTPHMVFNLSYVDEKYRKFMPSLYIASTGDASSGSDSDTEVDTDFTVSGDGVTINVNVLRTTMTLYSGDEFDSYETNAEPLLKDDLLFYKVQLYEFAGEEYMPDGETQLSVQNGGIISIKVYGANKDLKDTAPYYYGLFSSAEPIKLSDVVVRGSEDGLSMTITGTLDFSTCDPFIDEDDGYGENVRVYTGRYGSLSGVVYREKVALQGVEVSCTISFTDLEDLQNTLDENTALNFTSTEYLETEKFYDENNLTADDLSWNYGDIEDDDTVKITLNAFVDLQQLNTLLTITTSSSDGEDDNDEDGDSEDEDEDTDNGDTTERNFSDTGNSWKSYVNITDNTESPSNILVGYQYWLDLDELDDDEKEEGIKETKLHIGYNDIIGATSTNWNTRYSWDDIAKEEDTSDYIIPRAYLWLCDVYQKNIVNKFGGSSKEALQNNKWIVAGPAVNLENKDNTQVEWMWGDTWYQRYDCLKTYPFSDEDTNQVIEIGSFMCETHYNLDGRYDRNRALVSNINVNKENFNLMNDAYNQKNNYFTYQINDEYYYRVNEYPANLWWSNTKSAIADVDEFAHIHGASSMDLDSSYGKVTNIVGYNDSLYVLQDKAVLQLAYNDKAVVNTESGTPVEIANGDKVSDYNTIQTNVGCQDKFACVATTSGIYFVDNNNCTLYLLMGGGNSVGIYDLTDDMGSADSKAMYGLGSNFWFRDNRPSYTWRPILTAATLDSINDEYKGKQNGMALFWDPKYSDVYLIPGLDNLNTYRDALCFSEELHGFSSFMSYGGAVLFNHDAKAFAIAYQRQAVYYESTDYEQEIESDTASLKLYECWSDSEKTYNDFFGVIEPFSFTFVCNEYPTFTKVFDNIDIRMDQYDYNEETGQTELVGGTYSVAHQAGQPFNYIQVKNEYQDTGVKAFNPMALRKKFRVWRAQIPRNGNGRDRIRNTWAMITLGNDDPGTALSIVHDINVNFSI